MSLTERGLPVEGLLSSRYKFAETAENASAVAEIRRRIGNSDFAYILPHPLPDEDAIGSSIAFSRIIRRLNPHIKPVIVLPSAPKSKLDYLSTGNEIFIPTEDLSRTSAGEGFVATMDMGDSARVREELGLFADIPLINIDHHLGTPGSQHSERLVANLQDPQFESTTEALYWLTTQLGMRVDESLATPILSGLFKDTEYFADIYLPPRVHLLRTFLIEQGADESAIILNTLRALPPEDVVGIGKMLSKMQHQKNIAYVALTHNEYLEVSGSDRKPNTQLVVEYLRNIDGIDTVFVLYETEKGNGRCSLRSRTGKFNLDEVAKLFGGGGHEAAAAFNFQGDVETVLNMLKHALGVTK